ncbi:P-loop containing nucleoside triphosphate hydrolase protein [Lentinula raphanica]|uniref:DNA 3'-5' helicase n=1 Tax=Lentinula raphanica TaxID=153919 RepID=A0AA38UFL8_9AGAR|nr:P-loop containing nucleoside triphosphate hydrolase protein [Lentinula raphanica]
MVCVLPFVIASAEPLPGAVFQWFNELDEIVKGLYYLICTTWGGGARATEVEYTLYANYPDKQRNVYYINGLLTIVTEYSKTQSITGAGKLVARTPAYQVNRLLVLVLGLAFWAAGYIGCHVGMAKESCERYFYEVFVLTGHSMTSKKFSDVLGSFNSANIGVNARQADFRQLMACMLISATSTNFLDTEDEDPNVIAAHESFGHSLDTGRAHYGLESTASIGLAPDAVAHMQQPPGTLTNSPSANAIVTELFKNFTNSFSHQFLQFEQRTQAFMQQAIEHMGTQIIEQLRSVHNLVTYQNSRRAPVQPSVYQALKAVLRRKYDLQLGFTSPQQAELINSVGSSFHVLGVLETGGGKSLAFFGAPFLFPDHLFIVVSPLVALTEDLRRRLLETSIKGGVWGDTSWDPHTAQLVLVSAHNAGTTAFDQWLKLAAIRSRLKRVFVDEAHKIATDSEWRPCIRLLTHLTRHGVPLTLLSGSLMPRSIPKILELLHITDLSIVDEIRRYTGRPNLQYYVEKIEQDGYLDRIQASVQSKTAKFEPHDRGIIFMKTIVETEQVRASLRCPVYTGQMTIEQRRESELCWRRGLRPEDRWIVATQAFGQGVDYASVRTVIHKDPMELINFFQETGRAGRDGDPARCFCFWTELPPPAPDLKNDHLGRADMIMLLQTTACIRMSFASLDRETHSCLALNASPCMNCERLSLVPHAVAPVDLPNFNKPLVPNLPNDSSQLVPLSVPINAAMLSAKYDQGLEQLLLFKRILDDVEQCGCLDCWVKCDFHNTTTTHKRPWAFDPSLATLLRLKMKSGDFWPFCYNCWIPFREPCNHPPTEPYQKLDRDRCTHVWDDPTTGKLVPVVPTLIALIFTSRQELVTEMAQNLGQKWHTIGLLTDWLHEKVQSPSSAPNPVIFINLYFTLTRKA